MWVSLELVLARFIYLFVISGGVKRIERANMSRIETVGSTFLITILLYNIICRVLF